MIGNVWEWTTDWYSVKHEADAPKACCIPAKPARRPQEASYDPRHAQHQDSSQGAEGRVALVCAELLPPLSPGGAARGGRRYVDEPCRLSLRDQAGPAMSADTPSRGARVLAWLVVALAGTFFVLGIVRYGFSAEVYRRFWHDIAERPDGPMTFRFILQPTMAALAAIHDGIKDARLGRSPYFWTILQQSAETRRPASRGHRLDGADHPARPRHGCHLSIRGLENFLSGRSGADRPSARLPLPPAAWSDRADCVPWMAHATSDSPRNRESDFHGEHHLEIDPGQISTELIGAPHRHVVSAHAHECRPYADVHYPHLALADQLWIHDLSGLPEAQGQAT